MGPTSSVVIRAAVVLSVLASIGCNDDPASTLRHPDGTGRLYAVNISVYGSDFSESTQYVGFTETLEEGAIALSDAVELPGEGQLWGAPGAGEYYFTSFASVTLTKYRLVDDGRVEEVGRIGLTGAGVTMLYGEALVFDRPEKAFLFELNSAQILEVDLMAMEIVGRTNVPELIDPDQPTYLSVPLRRRGNKVIGSTYATDLISDKVSAISKIFSLDLETGELEVVDAPCGGLVHSVEAPNGDLYFASDPWVASMYAVGPTRSTAPCMVRVPAGLLEPDTEVVHLSELAGGRPTGGIIPGSEGRAYVRVLDTDAAAIGADTTGSELFSLSVWETLELDLADPSTTRATDRAPVAGWIAFFEGDGLVYENDSAANYSETTLLRITGDGTLHRGLRTPGIPRNILRLR